MSLASTTLPPPRPHRAGELNQRYHICFVCTGNICRSPTAEIVLRHLAAVAQLPDGHHLDELIEVSSAGTGAWHVDEPMDPRARTALGARSMRDHGHRARQVDSSWMLDVDALVCLDRRHLQTLRSLVPELATRLVLLRPFDRQAGGSVDIEDPYYGDERDFAQCLETIHRSCEGLVAALARELEQR